jgi:hypothetical protein
MKGPEPEADSLPSYNADVKNPYFLSLIPVHVAVLNLAQATLTFNLSQLNRRIYSPLFRGALCVNVYNNRAFTTPFLLLPLA